MMLLAKLKSAAAIVLALGVAATVPVIFRQVIFGQQAEVTLNVLEQLWYFATIAEC